MHAYRVTLQNVSNCAILDACQVFRIYSLADVQIKLATHANDMQYLKSARGVKTHFKHLYKLSIIIG